MYSDILVNFIVIKSISTCLKKNELIAIKLFTNNLATFEFMSRKLLCAPLQSSPTQLRSTRNCDIKLLKELYESVLTSLKPTTKKVDTYLF